MDSVAGRMQLSEARGDRALARGDAAGALECFAEACAAAERPPAGLVLKCARAALAAGDPAAAAAWALRTGDAAAAGYRDWAAAAALLGRCPGTALPRVRRRLRLSLAATWTTASFVPLLRFAAARLGIVLDIRESDFGQYFFDTLDPGSGFYGHDPEMVLLCPDERALGLRGLTEGDGGAAVSAELDRWTAVWAAIRSAGAAGILQHGFALRGGDPLGHYAAGFGGARLHQAAAVNAGLARQAVAADAGFVDCDRLAARLGRDQWFDDRSWYLAKIPYAPAALCRLAEQTAAVLAARLGLSRKCLVLDLDNTLWGGVIGDDGLEGIRIGGGAEGEAFTEFQHALKALAGRGVILAACSKNTRETALLPFGKHPEMVLREEDFAAFVANWQPKSENIREIARQLGIGLDSLTFLDDNPYEREQVRRALPEVDVPFLPEDPALFRRTLEDYPYFEPAAFTEADAQRAGQYRARARAEALRASADTLETYQASLEMVAAIGPVDGVSIERVVQLINKTNQFNLTTRRRNRAELEAFLAAPDTHHFQVRLRDTFADHGLIAVVLARRQGAALEIDTLLMSCRVIGRGVEQMILRHLADIALASGAREILGRYIPSGRNGMVADLYPEAGFTLRAEEADGTRCYAIAAEAVQGTALIAVEVMEGERAACAT